MTRTQAQTPADSLFDASVPADIVLAAGAAADSAAVAAAATPETSPAMPDAPAAESGEADPLLVAADSAEAAAVPRLPGEEYTLWYRRIAAEASDASPFPAHQVHYRQAAADEVFGTLAYIVPPRTPDAPPRNSLTDEAGFQGLVLLLAAAYVLLLSRHWQDVVLLPGPLARNRIASERLVDEPFGNNVGRLKRLSAILGLFLIGMVAVRCAGRLLPDGISDTLPPGSGPVLWVGAALLVMLLGAGQSALLFLAGAVTLNRPLIGRLQQLRRVFFASTVLLAAPALLFFTLAAPRMSLFWAALAVAVSVITSVVYVVGSLHLFLSKKISILYWFLYLCAVEIFPLSLLWLLAGR